ncbi:MAG: tetratricopeptide repeat protein, partial [Acidobacteria bacterium]|nr:tetratricopeptide repeat protein [Acidobacteriota bacterium]
MSDEPRKPRDPREDAETRTTWGRAGETSPTSDSPPPSGGPPGSGPPLLTAGDALGERYTVTRLIARGGMGEVYEAFDRELNERVALKTIRPELAGSAATAERFRREIQLARRVTHPNACRLFDLGIAEGPRGPVSFLTMELLEGESLSERLRRTGAMDAATALPIVRQVAAGLDAAHRAGVIHRDFKSGNVLLVPESGGVRAVVTDFGLARQVETGSDPAITMSGGGLVGSPAYMAPEQVEGLELTREADIYALGVVLYEMRTGALPFAGATPMSVAVKRLTEPPKPPSAVNPGIEPAWERTILRCLARAPGERFASAEAVVAALEGRAAGAGETGSRAAVRRRRWVGLIGALAALAVIGTVLWRTRSDAPAGAPPDGATRPAPSTAAPAAVSARRPVIAVLGFRNSSGREDAAWLSTALGEMLATELAAGERVRTVPGEVVARAEQGLGLVPSDSLAADTLQRLRGQLGVDYVVVGSYATLGEGSARQIRLDVRLQEATRGEIVSAVAETGGESALFELVGRAGGTLRERLGIGGVAPAETARVRSALPSDPTVARLYAEGLERLRAGDPPAARDRLLATVERDPSFALGHAALAEAWSTLGYDGKAREEAARAAALAGDLPREARLLIEGRQAEATRDWVRAVDAYGALYGFFPDNAEYGLRLARAQNNGGRAADALRTLEAIRSQSPAAGDDPRIGLLEAASSATLGDYRRGQQAAARAGERAAAIGARLLVTDCQIQEGWAWMRLGEPARAVPLFEEALRTSEALGQRSGVARARMMLGRAASDQGDFAAAQLRFDEALASFRETGDQRNTASTLNDLGNLLYDQGRLDDARRYYEKSATIYREVGNTQGLAGSVGNIANILDNQGDLEGARRLHEEAIALFREAGDQGGVARSTFNLGLILAAQGRLDEAQRRFEDALASHTERGYKRGIAFSKASLGELALARGDLAAAQRDLEASLALREELGEKVNAELSRSLLGLVALQAGEPAEAESLARQAVRALAAQQQVEYEANATVLLARALLAQERTADALAAARRASELAATSQHRDLRIDAALALARAEAASG